MTQEEIIKLGVSLGLDFNRKDNYDDLFTKGQVTFNGINGQRFAFYTSESKEDLLCSMGKALIQMGERKKCMEIHKVLSIN